MNRIKSIPPSTNEQWNNIDYICPFWDGSLVCRRGSKIYVIQSSESGYRLITEKCRMTNDIIDILDRFSHIQFILNCFQRESCFTVLTSDDVRLTVIWVRLWKTTKLLSTAIAMGVGKDKGIIRNRKSLECHIINKSENRKVWTITADESYHGNYMFSKPNGNVIFCSNHRLFEVVTIGTIHAELDVSIDSCNSFCFLNGNVFCFLKGDNIIELIDMKDHYGTVKSTIENSVLEHQANLLYLNENSEYLSDFPKDSKIDSIDYCDDTGTLYLRNSSRIYCLRRPISHRYLKKYERDHTNGFLFHGPSLENIDKNLYDLVSGPQVSQVFNSAQKCIVQDLIDEMIYGKRNQANENNILDWLLVMGYTDLPKWRILKTFSKLINPSNCAVMLRNIIDMLKGLNTPNSLLKQAHEYTLKMCAMLARNVDHFLRGDKTLVENILEISDYLTITEEPSIQIDREAYLFSNHLLYNHSSSSDIRICIGDITLYCHKTVLCSASGYFEKLFSVPFSECQSNEYIIDTSEFPPNIHKTFIKYCYGIYDDLLGSITPQMIESSLFYDSPSFTDALCRLIMPKPSETALLSSVLYGRCGSFFDEKLFKFMLLTLREETISKEDVLKQVHEDLKTRLIIYYSSIENSIADDYYSVE